MLEMAVATAGAVKHADHVHPATMRWLQYHGMSCSVFTHQFSSRSPQGGRVPEPAWGWRQRTDV